LNCHDVDVLDPKPSCGVVTYPAIRGQNATLSCSMTYTNYDDRGQVSPAASMTASISWESAAGVSISTATIPVTKALPPDNSERKIGEKIEVQAIKVATGMEIPKYNCTMKLNFTSSNPLVAVNSLSWTCESAPVLVWCKYHSAVQLPCVVGAIQHCDIADNLVLMHYS